MRVYIIASILIIMGLISIAVVGGLGPNSKLVPYMDELSSALLVGGLLAMLFKAFAEKDSYDKLRHLLRIHDSVDDLGLIQVVPQNQRYNFKRIIAKSKTLSIVLNDGHRWIGNHSDLLIERFGQDTETELFTVDPDSDFAKCLAAKISITESTLADKIHRSWEVVKECYENSSKVGSLKIYRLETFPTRSIFKGDEILVETPYQIASGRVQVPAFEYRKVARTDSVFSFAEKDIDAIRIEATLEWKSGGGQQVQATA